MVLNEVSRPNSVTYIKWTPIFEWCGISCGFKKRTPKDICLKEIGLCVRNLLTILDSIANTIRAPM